LRVRTKKQVKTAAKRVRVTKQLEQGARRQNENLSEKRNPKVWIIAAK